MSPSQQQYIEKYAGYAMEQMRRYGIPASVTLAQGMLESANGKSYLAENANNHFGIKGNYNGSYLICSDDRPNEKFRKYDNVGQSFEDHSKVLRSSHYQRYVSNLSPDDYQGWIKGIVKGGYATDKSYPQKLQSLIKNCDLAKYDKNVVNQMRSESREYGTESNPLKGNTNNVTSSKTNIDKGYSMPLQRNDFMLVTSPYGMRNDPINKGTTQTHHGIDIKAKHDTVLATENNGRVISVNQSTNTAAGKTVKIEYSREDGSKTVVQYMHLSNISCKVGDIVNAGSAIGVSGNTGTRTTGEHLHMGVYNINTSGKTEWVNPATYLSEISSKGDLTTKLLYNGKNLIQPKSSSESQSEDMSPDSWLSKLLGSSDSALESSENQGLIEQLFSQLLMLLTLAIKSDKLSQDEKMQSITDAVVNKKVDISHFTPFLRSSVISISEKGEYLLTIKDKEKEYNYKLTDADKQKISEILHSNYDDSTKQQKIGTFINSINISHQASVNYENIENQQMQQQQQISQRK